MPCAGGSVCAGVDASVAVCLEPAAACSYLGSDTICNSRGGYYGGASRGGGARFVPYTSYPVPAGVDPGPLTDDHDAYFPWFAAVS